MLATSSGCRRGFRPPLAARGCRRGVAPSRPSRCLRIRVKRTSRVPSRVGCHQCFLLLGRRGRTSRSTSRPPSVSPSCRRCSLCPRASEARSRSSRGRRAWPSRHHPYSAPLARYNLGVSHFLLLHEQSSSFTVAPRLTPRYTLLYATRRVLPPNRLISSRPVRRRSGWGSKPVASALWRPREKPAGAMLRESGLCLIDCAWLPA